MAQRVAVAGAAVAAATYGTSFVFPGQQSATVDHEVVALRGATPLPAPAASSTSPLLGLGLVGAAAVAAAPLARKSRNAAKVTTCAFEQELGVQSPAGFWDPLEFCKDGDADAFKRRRCVEIKHGRISMYACIGYIVPEYFRWPGYLSPSSDIKFTDVPNGLGAFSKVPLLGWLQILFFAGAIERTGWTLTKDAGIGFMQDASMKGEPGNYGLGFIGAFNTIKSEPALRARKLNSELANGRLAMVAILGLLFQNGTFGTTGSEMWGFEGYYQV